MILYRAEATRKHRGDSDRRNPAPARPYTSAVDILAGERRTRGRRAAVLATRLPHALGVPVGRTECPSDGDSRIARSGRVVPKLTALHCLSAESETASETRFAGAAVPARCAASPLVLLHGLGLFTTGEREVERGKAEGEYREVDVQVRGPVGLLPGGSHQRASLGSEHHDREHHCAVLQSERDLA